MEYTADTKLSRGIFLAVRELRTPSDTLIYTAVHEMLRGTENHSERALRNRFRTLRSEAANLSIQVWREVAPAGEAILGNRLFHAHHQKKELTNDRP